MEIVQDSKQRLLEKRDHYRKLSDEAMQVRLQLTNYTERSKATLAVIKLEKKLIHINRTLGRLDGLDYGKENEETGNFNSFVDGAVRQHKVRSEPPRRVSFDVDSLQSVSQQHCTFVASLVYTPGAGFVESPMGCVCEGCSAVAEGISVGDGGIEGSHSGLKGLR